MGITLLLRLNDEVICNINRFLVEVSEMEPAQYFYPESDLHVTVLSVISCFNDFKINSVNIKEYSDLINEVVRDCDPIKIRFKGVTISDSCVLIQGFPDSSLNVLRDNLRLRFKNSSLYNSIDSRYVLRTAHSTVIRFKNHLKNPEKFIILINKYRNFDFGTIVVGDLELVYNDWYQRVDKTDLIEKFTLRDY